MKLGFQKSGRINSAQADIESQYTQHCKGTNQFLVQYFKS